MFRIAFYHPEIPPNTGSAMRLAANTGSELHLIEPLGFSLDDKPVRRAGMDYRDIATVRTHASMDAAWEAFGPARVYAFAAAGERSYSDVSYEPGDVLLFGPESVGLPEEVLRAEPVTEVVRLPMVPGSRSLNLANAAAIAVYEAWRQHGFTGAHNGARA